jgi:hypothetical protein
MRPTHTTRSVALLSIAVLFAACSTSTGGSAAPTQAVSVGTLAATSVPQVTTNPSPSSEATTGTGPGGSAQPVAIDPCALLTADEASTAVGTKLGAGAATLVSQNRVCTWKSGTTEVKLIIAPPAADTATAQAYWDLAATQIPEGITITAIGALGDRAAYGSGGASGFSVSALFVIKGAQFFDFYCGLKACTQDASVTAANLIVSRLP